MAVALRIGRLHTRLQLPPEETEIRWQVQIQQLTQRALPAALDGVAERALSRAGLPPEAVVAVRRLRLRLKLADGAGEEALLRAWSQALETALAQALSRSDQGLPEVVVFPDAWTAEAVQLQRLARGLAPVWWADRLLDGRGEPLDLTPAAILGRWLERHPARAVAAMAELVTVPPLVQDVGALLTETEAQQLAEALAQRLTQRPGAEPDIPAAGTPLRALLETALERLRRHPQLGTTASAPPASLSPWRLALLLQAQPSLSLLSPPTLRAVADGLGTAAWASPPERPSDPASPPQPADPVAEELGWDQADTALANAQLTDGTPTDNPQLQAEPVVPSAAMAPQPSPLPTPDTTVLSGRSSDDPEAESAWIHAGGLLLLLNHPELFANPANVPPEPALPGNLALLALQRLLAPLGPGERAAALQQERPLLALLAPDRPWPERLQDAAVDQPETAERQLDALIAAIPQGVAFAPGALRQVYGPRHGASPPLPDRDSHRLAALLWRPGLLAWDRWQITLVWPLASADGALRRQGWDLDPGWQPALRRVVRFHYRADVRPPQEEQP
jgi:hypothetical protein